MNRRKHNRTCINPLLWILFGLLASTISCAKEMAPTGGPKDTTPPQLKKASPPNFSTNIKPKKITLTFDEFIEIKNQQQRVIISPPIKTPLSVTLKGRSIVVEIKDSLKPNTTYNINFSDVIRDFTEGNINNDFQYIFSTGPNIDTMYISGTVVDAFTGNPVENVQVGVYDNFSDSIVVKNAPSYLSKSNKEGRFVIQNVKHGDYKVFAILDIDNNMLYNLPNEAVAFIPDTLHPCMIYKTVTDTLHLTHTDPLSGNTVQRDSTVTRTIAVSTTEDITLRLFVPLYKRQFVKNVARHRRNSLAVHFNRPTATNIFLSDIFGNNYLKSPFSRTDSVVFFAPSEKLANTDTLRLLLSYTDLDSTHNLKQFYDSIQAIIDPLKNFTQDTTLSILSNINNKQLDLGKKFMLLFNNPIASYNFDKISVFSAEDTIFSKIKSVFVMDSTLLFATLDNKLLSDLNYRITIDSAAFTDVYGNISSQQTIEFQTQPESTFGVLAINILFDYPEGTVFELTDKEGKKVLWSEKPQAVKTLTIKHLKPGVYGLRMYYDKNNNYRQDTGDYFLKLLPEHTIRYPKDISIRANWDTEITWEIR